MALSPKLRFFSLVYFLSVSVFAEPQPKGIPLVSTTNVEFKPYEVTVRSSGVLANKSQQRLSFKVNGVIAEIFAEEGDNVVAGQLLASLDKSEILAQVKQAESLRKNAETNLKRLQQLQQDKLVSPEQLQAAQTQLDVANSDLEIARFNFKHSEIRAPQAGKIISRLVESKELVASNQAIFVVSNASAGWILRLGLSDKDIVKIDLGNEARISFDAYPNELFSAKVSELAAAANSRSRLFEVELQLANTEHKLLSGFIGRVEIVPSSNRRLAMLPIESIVTAQGLVGKVFVLTNDKTANFREVDIAFIRSDTVAISAGLEPGEQVITSGAAYVQPGLPVRL
jgi:multidrug efflux system membrane fusion protein